MTRRLHGLPGLAALLALLGPAPALAQCPYLNQLYQQQQQHQYLLLQYQQAHAHYSAPIPAWHYQPVHYPTALTYHPVSHNYLTYRPVTHTYATPRPHTLWTRPAHLTSWHTNPRPPYVPHATLTTHSFMPRPHALTTYHVTRPPSTQLVRPRPVAHQTRDTDAERFKAQLVRWNERTTWSYVRCGRCHQQPPAPMPRPAGGPALPQLNAPPPNPGMNPIAARPPWMLPLAAPRPALNPLAARPPLPAAWLPNLPSLALDTPARMTAPRLPRSAGKLPPPALDDTLRLPSAPADDPALTTLRDSPLLALTSRDDDPPPAVTTPVPPPAYPPLPVTGWEPPARAPDETPPDLAAPPVPQRVGGPPTAASPGESPALLPLTGAGRSWGAGDTVTLK